VKLEATIVGVVLLAALMHATWNAVVKSDSDRLISFALVQATGMIGGALLLLAAGSIADESWPYLIGSTVIHYVYYFLLLRAYAHGDLSHVYPIARGLGPLLVALFSGSLIGEHLSSAELAGVLAVSIGVFSLAFARGLPRGADLRATAFALMTGVTIASYTILDGLGVRASGNALGYIAWLNALEGPGVMIVALVRRPWPVLAAYLRTQWWRGCAGGAIAATGYGISIWAMGQGPVAHVAALRETSVLFAAIIGLVFLRESFGLWRISAAALIVAGLLLMHLHIGG